MINWNFYLFFSVILVKKKYCKLGIFVLIDFYFIDVICLRWIKFGWKDDLELNFREKK